MTAPPLGGRLRVALADRAASFRLCGIALAPDRRRTAIEWTPRALADGDDAGANVAVRQAPLMPGVHVVGDPALDGLPGFLADSLPDSWGRLLVDRRLRQHGIVPASLTGVDRLAFVGERGPGALVYEPENVLSAGGDDGLLDLDRVAVECDLVLEGGDATLLATLERAGGSAGGSRPKAWIAEAPDGSLRSGAHALAPGEVGWLVKFRARRHDPEDIAEVEHAYAMMARAAGLDVPEPRLFEAERGRYFGGRRFDRVGMGRVHCLTAAALLNVAPSQAMAADYADLLKLTRHVTRSAAEVDMAFRHAVFNVLSHNRDDHLKQFAFRRIGTVWTRTPAYDLTFSEGPGGEHTLLVAGEGRRPGRAHLRELAHRAGVKPAVAARIEAEVRDALGRWRELAEASGVRGSIAPVAEAITALRAAP